jgi:hypothetical protein
MPVEVAFGAVVIVLASTVQNSRSAAAAATTGRMQTKCILASTFCWKERIEEVEARRVFGSRVGICSRKPAVQRRFDNSMMMSLCMRLQLIFSLTGNRF